MALRCRLVAGIVACGWLVAVLMSGLAAAQPAKVKVGMNLNAADLPYFIAQDMGLFASEGLDVELIRFRSATEMIAPLGTGQLDVGGGGVTAALYNAVARGVTLKIVADKASVRGDYSPLMIMVRKDLLDSGAIKGIADLKGRKFGNISPGATGEHLIHKLMQKAGLGMGDVEQIYMPPPQLNTAMQNKAIDATLMTEPFTTVLMRRGAASILVPCKDVYPGMQVAAVFYGKSLIERPDVAQKFMNAYIRASRVYNDALRDGKVAGPGAEAVIATLAKWTEQTDLALLRDVAPHGLNPDGRLIMESVIDDFAFFKQRMLIEGNVTVEGVVDNGYAERSVREIGAYKPPT